VITATIWAFYLGFALSIGVYRQWLKGTLNVLNKTLFGPVLITFFLIDILLNYTLFMLMGFPPKNCYTISDRLAYYHLFYDDWRHSVAEFVCEKLLNPVDPAGGHC
jgi:hypothetical protein